MTMADLLPELTLEEKAALCLGSTFWHTSPVHRLGIPAVMLADGPHGLRRQPDGNQAGISGSLPATCFPTASALGSSWDPELVRRIGAAIGVEARAQGVGVVLGPGVNIKRSPLCGRNFEYFSEDPLLTGALGEAHVTGVQSQGVGACVKHFAANNQETDRLRVSAEVDERTLREIYLPHFERVVTRAQPWLVMCAYNRINGTYASEHGWLLTDVLRTEWGFDGVVVSDWGAVHDRVAALAAGLDLEMPPNLGVSDAALVAAVRGGTLDEHLLDRAALRILRLVDQALAAGPPPAADDAVAGFDVDAHHALARTAAADCAVLLKNEADLLPLRPSAGDVIAVIGEFARTPRFQGAGSSQVNPTRLDVALEELRAAVPTGVHVPFAAGFGIQTTDQDHQLAAEAVALAARAGTVVVFLGLPGAAESEGADRPHIALPDNQTALLPRLAAANPNLVVVLANGSAVRLADWDGHARAILETWLSGQAAGGATADLLLGTVEPAGRLAETLPLRLEDTPAYLNFPGEDGHVRYGEGVFVGYRGYDAVGRDVAYPFGHGLSYTTFDYRDLTVTVTGRVEDGDLTVAVSCTVAKTGRRPGKEVVQLYVGAPQSQVARPIRELKDFVKVDLAPGAAERVSLTLSARDLSYWSTGQRRWVLQAGTFDIGIGRSSRDLRLSATVEIDAPPVPVRLDAEATLREWLADPAGADALRRVVGVDATGRPRGILGDHEAMTVLGDFPLRTLTAFPGLGIDRTVLAVLLDRLDTTG
ncbi:glycoside hydrolase family 3 C-terminal domain-containing protein [Verrucosispora sp. WMMA2121]|uniref:glycoside hydrolase family 3 C-terminal domain-containing protein n=1 Tax=Verrucosispora sp. WMMA2121 TaxID=3015164 RepID=UPI0022B6EFF7|nr:glycoside hydrolase family 3 C-terminal domain-containing protein [Verrucosispora sp. WMMA2121]MCZ7422104.1 glycoside hydrolase family 3 C-terminal domain-containing protein [Verrucosispora sp. WMMA2121]